MLVGLRRVRRVNKSNPGVFGSLNVELICLVEEFFSIFRFHVRLVCRIYFAVEVQDVM